MLQIKPFSQIHVDQIVTFIDKWSGDNYGDPTEISYMIQTARFKDSNACFGAFYDEKLVGIRLTYAPNSWMDKIDRGLTPFEWKVPSGKVAYFKSLFIADDFQGKGIGKELSSKSIEVLKSVGAQAVICHSWLESPNNSSQRYLQKMGFESVKEHRNFWYEVDYRCVKCGDQKCVCTAIEMIKYI